MTMVGCAIHVSKIQKFDFVKEGKTCRKFGKISRWSRSGNERAPCSNRIYYEYNIRDVIMAVATNDTGSLCHYTVLNE